MTICPKSTPCNEHISNYMEHMTHAYGMHKEHMSNYTEYMKSIKYEMDDLTAFCDVERRSLSLFWSAKCLRSGTRDDGSLKLYDHIVRDG